MEKLLNTIKPKDDELMISVMYRMAFINGVYPISFINGIKDEKNTWELSIIDDKMPIIKLQKEIYKDISLIDLFRKHTLFDGLAPFYVDYKQFTILYSAAQRPYGYDHFETAIKNKAVLAEPKICPQCCKEGLVLYRHQNLPGVKVCLKHKIPLKQLKIYNKEYNKNKMFDVSNYEDIEMNDINEELMIAQFSKDFMDNAFDINKNEMYMFIRNNINNELVTSGRRIRDGFEFEKGIKELMKKYNSVIELKKDIEPYIKKPKQSSFYEERGYKLLSEPRNNIVELEHMKCGTKFLSNSWALDLKLGCPMCMQNQSKDTTIKNAVENQSNNTFTYVNNSFNKKGIIDMIHKCGKHKKIRFADYLGYTPVCECEIHTKADKEKIRRRLEALTQDDFSVRQHPNSNKIIATCKKCGRTQVVTRNSFKKNRLCRYCFKEADMKQKLNKRTQNTFEVIRYPTFENRTCELKCLKCGNTFTSDLLYTQKYRLNKNHPYGLYKCDKCGQQSFETVICKNGTKIKLIFDALIEKYPNSYFTVYDVKKITYELYKQGLIIKPEVTLVKSLVDNNIIQKYKCLDKVDKKSLDYHIKFVYKINPLFLEYYKKNKGI